MWGVVVTEGSGVRGFGGRGGTWVVVALEGCGERCRGDWGRGELWVVVALEGRARQRAGVNNGAANGNVNLRLVFIVESVNDAEMKTVIKSF